MSGGSRHWRNYNGDRGKPLSRTSPARGGLAAGAPIPDRACDLGGICRFACSPASRRCDSTPKGVTSTPHLARLALAAGIAASGALPGALTGGAGLTHPICVSAGTQNHAAIVVEHSDGATLTTCVGFDAAQLTGKQLLVASGIQYGVSTDPNNGDELCQVDHEPQTYPSPCLTPSMPYWALTHANYGGAWGGAHKRNDRLIFFDGDAQGGRYESAYSPPKTPAPSPPA